MLTRTEYACYSLFSIVLLTIGLTACRRSTVVNAAIASDPVLSREQITALASKKVYFGHKSVGANIIQGIRELMAADPRLKIALINSADPSSVRGPAFVESEIGENGDPQSKNAGFLRAVEKGLGAQAGIAMYKYCYVDITESTDVQQMFANYRHTIDILKAKYPSLKIVHITVPLTTVEPATKAWLKVALGRSTAREVNFKRNQFNELLRKAYVADPIFDLAEVESTHANGSRSYFTSGTIRVYTLAPEYTTDGGHLNEAGRRAAAQRLLTVLASL